MKVQKPKVKMNINEYWSFLIAFSLPRINAPNAHQTGYYEK